MYAESSVVHLSQVQFENNIAGYGNDVYKSHDTVFEVDSAGSEDSSEIDMFVSNKGN